MIEITDGITAISAGADRVEELMDEETHARSECAGGRCPTGVRVVVEFRRDISLPAGQAVTVRYDFAGDGNFREGTGIAKSIGTVQRWGRPVVYHYRVSYWIIPAALMDFLAPAVRTRVRPPMIQRANEFRAVDPTPA